MQSDSTNTVAVSGEEAICTPETKERFFGKRFGHLVVQDAGHRRDKNNQLLLLAHCDCGIVCFIRVLPLTRGQISCSGKCLYSKGRESLDRRLKQASTTKLESAKKRVLGLVLGRLTVESYSHAENHEKRGNLHYWLCSCSCGNRPVLPTHELTPKRRQSCGCLVRENAGKTNIKHGLTYSKEWNSWYSMFGRCYDPNNQAFHNYGGRPDKPIKICQRWQGRDGFINFLSDMGPRPTSAHSIDRYPDQNGDYEPSNCRWAVPKEQARNKRNNVVLTYQNRTACIAEWAELLGVESTTIFWRYRKGMPMDQVLSVYNALSGRPLKKVVKRFE